MFYIQMNLNGRSLVNRYMWLYDRNTSNSNIRTMFDLKTTEHQLRLCTKTKDILLHNGSNAVRRWTSTCGNNEWIHYSHWTCLSPLPGILSPFGWEAFSMNNHSLTIVLFYTHSQTHLFHWRCVLDIRGWWTVASGHCAPSCSSAPSPSPPICIYSSTCLHYSWLPDIFLP